MSGPAPHRLRCLSGVRTSQREPIVLGTAPSMLGEPPGLSSTPCLPAMEPDIGEPLEFDACTASVPTLRGAFNLLKHITLHLRSETDSGNVHSGVFDCFGKTACSSSSLIYQQFWFELGLERGALVSLSLHCVKIRFGIGTASHYAGETLLKFRFELGLGCILDRLTSKRSLARLQKVNRARQDFTSSLYWAGGNVPCALNADLMPKPDFKLLLQGSSYQCAGGLDFKAFTFYHQPETIGVLYTPAFAHKTLDSTLFKLVTSSYYQVSLFESFVFKGTYGNMIPA
ncbi:hypothetical protein B0H15DRAFT_801588 [Mycena belliarum]|uniref:Uncharacterized protein n=1 Tax=Mycena belliarum TaxID=1033014 RepID=A0AAD6U4B2_9AGAR|nr:hypothetical protein B0H15DRAFT_801588 [Mycena belliae]